MARSLCKCVPSTDICTPPEWYCQTQDPELQEMARIMLVHAHRRWPAAITANLWPYAIRMANNAINMTPNLKFKDFRTPLETFSNSRVTTNPKHWYHFGCPVYTLNAPLQMSGGIHHKWKEQARLGLYLGQSPQHARSVALVLDIETGFVSPQFHVKFDPLFQTVQETERKVSSLWQEKCGFVANSYPSAATGDTTNVVPTSQQIQIPQQVLLDTNVPTQSQGY
jgi:hypothetical protein